MYINQWAMRAAPMDQHTTTFESQITTPGVGAQGKRGHAGFFTPGSPLQNSPQNHSNQNLTKLENSVENFLNSFSSENNVSVIPENSKKSGEKITVLPAIEGPKEKLGKVEYNPDYGPLMYAWFLAKEKTKNIVETYTWKNGEVDEKVKKVPNPPPHFSEFARTIGVTKRTLDAWAKNNKEFAEYLTACEDYVQEFFVDNGVTGEYSSQFGIFAAKNLTKMKDVQINKNQNVNIKDVLDALEKGIIDNTGFIE